MLISPISKGRPTHTPCSEKAKACYDLLDALSIPYTSVTHDRADTIADCLAIEAVLGTAVCKNLFLTNKQRSAFYLLLLPGDKPFRTADFSKQVGSSRLSFASSEDMEAHLGVLPGSVTLLGLMHDRENRVRLCIDEALLSATHIGMHPCDNTASVKLAVSDILHRLIPALHHEMTLVHPERKED